MDPVTPERVEWRAPPGAWTRNFRIGEWLGSPITPLFETWLLERIEDGFSGSFQQMFGFPARPPYHAIINGWYFASLNFFPSNPVEMLGTLARYFLPRFARRPRWTSVALPPLAGLGVELHVSEWRDKILPAYRDAVAAGEVHLASLSPRELFELIDELGRAAGAYFASITIVAGFAWKTELPLAEWIQKRGVARSHLSLVSGLGAKAAGPHSVTSIDWFHPTLGELDVGGGQPRGDLGEARRSAEASIRGSLDGKSRAQFDDLLAKAQRFARLREEQIADFTLPWPLLRRAARRLAEPLLERGILDNESDIFFVTRNELAAAALHGAKTDLRPATRERRSRWQQQRSLAPPLILGDVPPMLQGVLDRAAALYDRGASPSALRGLGASPGRAVGRVRVLRSADEFNELQPGEILVAPVTTPAWTPLFERAAAVVTDTGSLLAHASLVAREYGIPAVVGTGDATHKLRNGQSVEVDGSAGTVTIRS